MSLPFPPAWSPHATVSSSRFAGEFLATVPAPGEGGLLLSSGMDDREAANQLADYLSGRRRKDAKYADAAEVVGVYREGRWYRLTSARFIKIVADL